MFVYSITYILRVHMPIYAAKIFNDVVFFTYIVRTLYIDIIYIPQIAPVSYYNIAKLYIYINTPNEILCLYGDDVFGIFFCYLYFSLSKIL